VSGKIFFI